MTDEQLQAIKARRAIITPAPWATVSLFVGEHGEYNGRTVVIGAYTNKCNPTVASSTSSDDAEFIAAAPADIDALLAEVDALRRRHNLPSIIESEGKYIP